MGKSRSTQKFFSANIPNDSSCQHTCVSFSEQNNVGRGGDRVKHPKMNGNVKYECWYISRFTACSCCIAPLITSLASQPVTALRSQQEDGRVPACSSPCLRRKQQNLYCCKKQTNKLQNDWINSPPFSGTTSFHGFHREQFGLGSLCGGKVPTWDAGTNAAQSEDWPFLDEAN